jgi:hypothetical protein
MQFGNDMQKNVYTMLATWFADDIKRGVIHQVAEYPLFMLRKGSTILRVGINKLGDGEASITVAANVVEGAKMTGELLLFLLAHNRNSLFGAFGIDPESGMITCDHSILGSTCDQQELAASMTFVAEMADRYDDMIIEKFGGKTALQIATEK